MDTEGRVVKTIGANQDITERKNTEAQLLIANFAVRSSISAISLADLEGRITYVNDSFLSLWGYAQADEVLGRYISDFAVLGIEKQATNPTLRGLGYIGEGRAKSKDGSSFYVQAAVNIVVTGEGEPVCMMASFIDITTRKKMEDALRESEARFRSYVESSPLAVIVSDREGRIVDVNRAAIELLGFDAATLSRMHVWELHPTEDREGALRRLAALGGEGYLEAEFRFQRQDRSHVWVSLHATMIADGFSLAYCSDITSRKEAEEALRRYKLLSESSRDIILFMGREGEILEANMAAENAYGYSREELLGLNVRDLRAPESVRFTDAQMTEADEQGVLFETTHQRRDGSTFPVEVSSQGTTINETRTLVSVVRDITERRSLQVRLIHSQKMEAIGTLAGGVAHDFNNILTVIMGLGNLIQMSLDPGDRNRSYVDQIVLSSERAADLTQSLLAYSRKQRMTLEPHRVRDVVASAAKLLKRLVSEDVNLKLELADDSAVALLDVSQIDQVLMNLATNARDAMPNGGSLPSGRQWPSLTRRSTKLTDSEDRERMPASPSLIRVWAWLRKLWRASSIPFLPQKKRGKGPVWALRAFTGS